MHLTVGSSDADIVGTTNIAIQAALDHLASTGGGTVQLLPGVYTLRVSLRIPPDTHLLGAGQDTMLRKAPGWQGTLWEDGDWGDAWVGCEALPPVKLGDGVLICSDRQQNWHSTVGTVLEIDANRFRISDPFKSDYMVADHARVSSAHPLIAIENSPNVRLSNMVLDGNIAENPQRMDGCRGGGVWAFRSPGAILRHLTIRDVNGDAASFQKCHDWLIEDCTFTNNAGNGIHPGTGTQRPIVRNCISRHNRGWGIFVCWQVKHGRFENNHLEHNHAGGISIGHKDTDNFFIGNRLLDNAGPAAHFRDETFPMAPHRCVFERNVLRRNNATGPQILIDGQVHDLIFRDNDYDPETAAFQVGPGVANLTKDKQ